MQNREVKIRDIGPITEFVFSVPEDGGVVELRGPNGIGKTRALEAVNAMVTGQAGGIEHRDGVVGGEVTGFGATLKVMRQARRSGELEVVSIEGRFSVLDLVDPKLKSPEAADNKRIKALVQLAGGAGADPSLFYKLVGGQEAFTELVSTKAMANSDLVTMAGAIKRDLEDKARDFVERATKASIAAESDRTANEGLNMEALDDERKLADDYALTLQEEAALKQRARSALEAEYSKERAAAALAEAEKNHTGVGVAQANVADAAQEMADCEEEIRGIEALLRRAVDKRVQAEQRHELALEAERSAVAHENTIAQWRAQLAAEIPQGVTDEELATAASDVKAAQEAMQLGTLVREAKRRLAQADKHAQQAARFRTQADRLREAAKGTDDVLSEVVGRLGCPLSVSQGRLVTPTDRSETELFSDLSRGEQWTLALGIAIEAVGHGGLLVIDQEGWEGIDPDHKALIAQRLKGSGVVLITAHCDVGELRAETLDVAAA